MGARLNHLPLSATIKSLQVLAVGRILPPLSARKELRSTGASWGAEAAYTFFLLLNKDFVL